jgi:hypothetical protein
MCLLQEVYVEQERQKREGLDPATLDPGDLALAAAAVLCDNFGFGGVTVCIWPHNIVEIDPEAPDERTAIIRAVALALLELERIDAASRS